MNYRLHLCIVLTMIQDKYEYRKYLMQLSKIKGLWRKLTFLEHDLKIFKEDPAMNREREDYINNAKEHIIPMKLELEKVIEGLKEDIKEYDKLRYVGVKLL